MVCEWVLELWEDREPFHRWVRSTLGPQNPDTLTACREGWNTVLRRRELWVNAKVNAAKYRFRNVLTDQIIVLG